MRGPAARPALRPATASPAAPPAMPRRGARPTPPRAARLAAVAALAAAGRAAGEPGLHARIRAAVQPVLDQMAQKHNTSFSFGFTDENGSVSMASGVDSVWTGQRLTNETLIPLGSVTKSFTAIHIMQAVEQGKLALEDLASKWVDPILQRIYQHMTHRLPAVLNVTNATLEGLWGPQARTVTIGDLLGMTSGFADYADDRIMDWTLRHAGEDMPPWAYLVSASRAGFECAPRTCATYSGANYVLLGFVLVQLEGVWSWQDLNQMAIIPRALWESSRYRHMSFPKLGRCSQYTGIAHQYAAYRDPTSTVPPKLFFNDLENDSCLNGWTMGNIAATGGDLANFFYDVFTLAPTGKGYVNATTLSQMMAWKDLKDDWCWGPTGPGSCKYGMGLFRDQLGQDVFPLMNPLTADKEAIRIDGHPGQDWGSSCGPCGYNSRYKFGICVARTSAMGMNCSNPYQMNALSSAEVPCKVYDAVLAVFGAPRLRCLGAPGVGLRLECSFGNATPGVLGKRRFGGAWMAGQHAAGDAPWAQFQELQDARAESAFV